MTTRDPSFARVTIDSLADDGAAVARLDDGRLVFVRGGCPGDEAEIELLDPHRRGVSGRLVRIVESSPHRVAPPCPYFGQCSGCQWQHVHYDTQLSSKTALVADACASVPHLADTPIERCIPSERSYGYRNRIELFAAEIDTGLRLGFRSISSDSIIPVDKCALLPDNLQEAPRSLTGALRHLRHRHGELGVRSVALRTAASTDDIEIALWTDPGPFPRQIAGRILSDALGASGVVRVLVKGPHTERRVTQVEVLRGRGYWQERLADCAFSISAPTSFPVNTPAGQTLVSTVVEMLSPAREDRVLDTHARAGVHALPLARLAKEVTAIESSHYAIVDLRRNLEHARLPVEAVGGEVSRELNGLGSYDLAVVDAPRTGIPPSTLASLARASPRRVAYISCDPRTLARDTTGLAAAGYKAVRVVPVDVLPQTNHVKTIALFELT